MTHGQAQRSDEDALHTSERALGVVLDVVQPARAAPRERDEDGEHGEDGKRIAVLDRCERAVAGRPEIELLSVRRRLHGDDD